MVRLAQWLSGAITQGCVKAAVDHDYTKGGGGRRNREIFWVILCYAVVREVALLCYEL